MKLGPLGLGIDDNPLVNSPFIQSEDTGVGVVPPPPQMGLLTESGLIILTEAGIEITTE